MHKRLSVAEGKREFTPLLKKAKEKGIPILVFNERRDELVGVILPTAKFARYERLRAYFQALRLFKKFAGLGADAAELVQEFRKELEERTE